MKNPLRFLMILTRNTTPIRIDWKFQEENPPVLTQTRENQATATENLADITEGLSPF